MNRITPVACVVLLIAAPMAAVANQNVADKKSSTDQQAKPAAEQKRTLEPAEQKILSVLKQLLELQKSFADENVRVGIQVEIADMLWSYDEPRARSLFEEAFLAINSPKPVPLLGPRMQLLTVLARRDSALALKLVQSIEISANADTGNTPDGERAHVQLDLAQSILMAEVQNPSGDAQRMVQAVKPFAERGDVPRLIPLLRQMRVRDAKLADELFVQAFEKAKLGQPSFDDLRSLASYLFPHFGDGVISFTSARVDPMEAIQVSPSLIQQVLAFTYDSVLKRIDSSLAGGEGARLNPRSFLSYGIPKVLAPYFDRFMPDRAEAFRARLEEVRRAVRPEEQIDLALTEPGTVQELLARAERLADPSQRDTLYEKAARQASYSMNYDLAATITEKINDETIRSRQRNMFNQQGNNDRIDEIRKAIQDGDYDRAAQMISGISIRSTRMWMFQSLIGTSFRKDKDRATQLLADAQQLAGNLENGVDRGLELIGLARVAGILDTNRGFDEMKLAILEFNRAGIAPDWEKYEVVKSIRGGETAKTVTQVNVGVSAFLGNPDFQWLGSTDFDRGLVLAQQVQVQEASALAQLAVCRGAVSKLQALVSKKVIAPEKPPAPDKAKQR